MTQDRDLRGAVVAVVGASGGLGSRIARLLSARGAEVVLAGRDAGRLAEVGLDGGVVVTLDITDATAGDTLVDAVQTHFGRLDGVVNASGAVAFGPLDETEDAVLEHLFMTNVIGPLWLARRVVPLLTESKGFLVQISGVIAEQPMPRMVAYSASKAALAAADHGLAKELRRAGVTVHDARPPHTETGLAGRPVAGKAPNLGAGLDPDGVAERIVRAVETGERDLPPGAFAAAP